MSIDWQDAVVAVIAILAVAFLYRHFRPRRRVIVAVIPAGSLRVRQPRPSSNQKAKPPDEPEPPARLKQ